MKTFVFLILLGGIGWVLTAGYSDMPTSLTECRDNIRASFAQESAGSNVSVLSIDPVSAPETIYTAEYLSTDIEDYEKLFNDYRWSNYLTGLYFTNDLNKVAQKRLIEIQEYFSHDSAAGYNDHLAENIVMGVYSNGDALNCWKNSPGHNLNMLDSFYIATGYAIGGGYAVQLFTKYDTINGEPQLPPGYYWRD